MPLNERAGGSNSSHRTFDSHCYGSYGVYGRYTDGDNDDCLIDGKSKTEPIGVYELMERLRKNVACNFPYPFIVRGEISSVKATKHCYFTLREKSPEAQIPAIIWSRYFDRIACPLREGLEVVCTGTLEVSPRFGKCNFIVTDLKPFGVGQFETEKKLIEERLRREGLLDVARKRPLPSSVSRVGVVTSLSTAALQDFLKILKQRSKRVNVVVANAKVQGMEAPKEIVRALRLMYSQCRALNLDVLALIRGGGSQEDLWTFNNEEIARTVAESPIPLVTGIGHETDTSVCDLVSDFRASTPSDAAARITPMDDASLHRELDAIFAHMVNRLEQLYYRSDQKLRAIESSAIFANPFETLYEKRVRLLDDLEARMSNAIQQRVLAVERQYEVWDAKLKGRDPKAALARGYSLTQRVDDMKILRSPSEVQIGQIIETTLASGKIRSVVIE